MTRESMDSREGFDEAVSREYESHLDRTEREYGMSGSDEYDRMDDEMIDDDYDDYEEDDGQPSEYDEWQDVYGGDDWDNGQYDSDYSY